MRAMPLLAVLLAASPAIAQANCSAGAGPPASIVTQNPFFGNSLYGHPNYPNSPGPNYPGFNFLFDLTPVVAINMSQIDMDFYDSGGLVQVNSTTTVVSPNQVGTVTPVEVYVIPGVTWSGNELNPSAWTLYGTGSLTVQGPHVHSPAVFNPPMTFPPGLWAVAVRVPPTTTGLNPGPLHPMLDPLTTPPVPYPAPAATIDNLRFQREAWTATVVSASHRQNLEFHFTPMSGYANWTSFGTGCVAPNEPVLSLTTRPVIGTTITFQTANIQPNTLFNFWLLGFVPDATGFGLGAFGLPGCNLYLQLGSPMTTSLTSVNAGVATAQIAIPLDPTYVGVVLYGQAAPMTSGFNAGGFFASNGVCVAFGLL